MKGSIRIQKKVFTYSLLCRLLGILSEEEFKAINKELFSE